ncbi:MAG: DUF624 domain-containing protein [Oscillospiraceae bacterium]|nr:DUF624 domain-containing protein [Oscillospiraceae bacterium]
MNPRQAGNGLLRFLEIFADLCIVSVYWLVCCIPMVTISAASAALYSTVTRVIRDEKGTLTRTFFTEFRQSVKTGILLSLVFVGGCALICVYVFLGNSIEFKAEYLLIYWVVVFILAVILTGTFIYVFQLQANFRQKTWALIRTGFVLSVGYPVKTLGLICMLALTALIILKLPMLILLLPGTYVFLASIILEPIIEKHTAKGEKLPETQKDCGSSDENS